jgi:hypothetical protein
MYILLLIKLFITISHLDAENSVNSDGWVAVERADKEAAYAGADEVDPSIWVVFAKKIGGEKILASFPVEPSYKYSKADGSEMEIAASSEGSHYRIFIEKPMDDFLNLRKNSLQGVIFVEEKTDEMGSELIYWENGFWTLERLISTEEHSYILQAKSIALESVFHRKFISSFDLEKK